MSYNRTAPAGLVPTNFETITLSNSTAVGFNSTTRTYAKHIVFSVETNNVRMRADGTDPTASTGVLYQSTAVYTFASFNGTTNHKFLQTAGSATVSVMGYTFPGEATP